MKRRAGEQPAGCGQSIRGQMDDRRIEARGAIREADITRLGGGGEM